MQTNHTKTTSAQLQTPNYATTLQKRRMLVALDQTFFLVPPAKAYITLTEVIMSSVMNKPGDLSTEQMEDLYFLLKFFEKANEIIDGKTPMIIS